MLSPAILAGLLATCAPNIDPYTETALITVESGGDSWAMHQNGPDRSFSPRTYQEAVRIGTQLLADSHSSVDVGLTQVNSGNFAAYGVTLTDMLDPCTNLRVGAAILAVDYRREWAATSTVPPQARPQTALRRALQEYNSGSPTAAPQYTNAIIRALGSRLVRLTVAATSLPSTVTSPPAPTPRFTRPPRQSLVAAAPLEIFRNVQHAGTLSHAARLPGPQALPHVQTASAQ